MIGLKGRLNVRPPCPIDGILNIKVIDNSGALIAECVNVLKVKTRYKSSGAATVGECFSRGSARQPDDLDESLLSPRRRDCLRNQ